MSAIPERIPWAVEQLEARTADLVLEIGCGPGHAVALLCERLKKGRVTAIDRSSLQVTRARERNASCIAAGRARIETLELIDAPSAFGARSFHRILAVNVNAFWTRPQPSLEAAASLLRTGGVLCLAWEPPSLARARHLEASLPRSLEEAGLKVLAVRRASFRTSHGVAILAQR